MMKAMIWCRRSCSSNKGQCSFLNQSENGGNQDGDVENQGRNLGIAVEMTQESNGNDKFKECREVKIIENEHICKDLFLHITF